MQNVRLFIWALTAALAGMFQFNIVFGILAAVAYTAPRSAGGGEDGQREHPPRRAGA